MVFCGLQLSATYCFNWLRGQAKSSLAQAGQSSLVQYYSPLWPSEIICLPSTSLHRLVLPRRVHNDQVKLLPICAGNKKSSKYRMQGMCVLVFGGNFDSKPGKTNNLNYRTKTPKPS